MDPRWELNVAAQRTEAEIVEDANLRAQRDKSYRAAAAAERHSQAQPTLSEAERRRVALGDPDPHHPDADPAASLRALAGRRFLRAIRQEPDWNLLLGPTGVVMGRLPPSADPHSRGYCLANSFIDPGEGPVWNAAGAAGAQLNHDHDPASSPTP